MATRTVTQSTANANRTPKSLAYTLAELANDTVALANELRTDHATSKVTVDQMETLIEELAADHATTKVTVDQLETLAEELGADHATTKTADDETRAWATEVDGDENNINDHLDYLLTPDGVIGGSYSFSAGAAVTLTGSGFVQYRIGGVEFHAPVGAVTLEDLGDITVNLYGSWRVEIDRLGALTAKAPPTVGGYTTEQIALLAMAGLAPTANTVTLGYLTIIKTGSAFNIGTDNLNVATATAAIYYERGPRKRISGLNAALGAASTLTAASTTYGHGTIDANMNGLKKAQIAAGAAQALTDADTIATLNWGNVLICTNLAGTGKVSINAAGTPGVTAMSYASAAAALTASDLVVDRLPSMFVPIALIKVNNQSGGTFTFKTTNWDAASVTSTITDAGIAGWNRTVVAGFNSHQISRVAIPADVTAPIPAAAPATLAASITITSGPATLAAATAITAGPATLSAAAVDDISFRESGAP